MRAKCLLKAQEVYILCSKKSCHISWLGASYIKLPQILFTNVEGVINQKIVIRWNFLSLVRIVVSSYCFGSGTRKNEPGSILFSLLICNTFILFWTRSETLADLPNFSFLMLSSASSTVLSFHALKALLFLFSVCSRPQETVRRFDRGGGGEGISIVLIFKTIWPLWSLYGVTALLPLLVDPGPRRYTMKLTLLAKVIEKWKKTLPVNHILKLATVLWTFM